jgi:hypothetical protein
MTDITESEPAIPVRKFAKQPLNFKFVNADSDLAKNFANCKFFGELKKCILPIVHFKIYYIITHFLFVSVSEETPGKKRKPPGASQVGPDGMVRTP